MRPFVLTYWTKEPHSVLIEEIKKFRNTAEGYRYISKKGGIPIFVR